MSEDRLDPTLTTRIDFERVGADVVASAAGLSAATLHEAGGKIGALPAEIKPLVPGWRVCGPAVTVHSPGGDNLWLHRAIYACQPGDVLVVHVSDQYEHGYWGEVMATAARAVGIAGLIIDGGVRDSVLLGQIGFPVFSRGLSIRGTGKDFGARGWINAPTRFGDTTVNAGDLMFGDADGVVCITREKAAAVVAAGHERDAWEAGLCTRLEQGETTLDLFGFRAP